MFMLIFPHQVTSKVFEFINIEDILSATDDEVHNFPWCICKEDLGGEMIFCDNRKCPKGEWFHLDCLDLSEDVSIHHNHLKLIHYIYLLC